jgi:hypothetical protein
MVIPMSYPAPNLQALLDKLAQGSLARKLVETFQTGESLDAIRQELEAIVEEEVRRKRG